jgi:hypothetical protein
LQADLQLPGITPIGLDPSRMLGPFPRLHKVLGGGELAGHADRGSKLSTPVDGLASGLCLGHDHLERIRRDQSPLAQLFHLAAEVVKLRELLPFGGCQLGLDRLVDGRHGLDLELVSPARQVAIPLRRSLVTRSARTTTGSTARGPVLTIHRTCEPFFPYNPTYRSES